MKYGLEVFREGIVITTIYTDIDVVNYSPKCVGAV
jgi:hypothetical protein